MGAQLVKITLRKEPVKSIPNSLVNKPTNAGTVLPWRKPDSEEAKCVHGVMTLPLLGPIFPTVLVGECL